jgi:hypothetical protein
MAKFPVLAVLLLTVGIVWLLAELEVIIIKFPWAPVILIVIAIGLIWNRFFGKRR